MADLKVAGNKPAALPGLYLANIRGDVRLEWLRIGRWNGEIPREARNDQARIHRADGSIVYGQLTGFRPDFEGVPLQDREGRVAHSPRTRSAACSSRSPRTRRRG